MPINHPPDVGSKCLLSEEEMRIKTQQCKCARWGNYFERIKLLFTDIHFHSLRDPCSLRDIPALWPPSKRDESYELWQKAHMIWGSARHKGMRNH